MPDTGSPYFLPYPTLSDETDANKYLKQLAEAQDAALKMLVPRSARFKTTGQVLTAGTFQTIMFDAEEALPQGAVAIPYSAGVWTIQQPGVYFVSATTHMQSATSIQFRLAIAFSGSWTASGTVTVHEAPGNGNANAVKAMRLVAGDTVQIQAFCEVAGGSVYGHASIRYTNVDISWVAP